MKTPTTCLARTPVKFAAFFVFSCFPIILSAADTDVSSKASKEIVAPKISHIEKDGDRVTVSRGRFTDQSKPGTLKIEGIPFAKLKIKGTSSDEIVIVSELDQKGRNRVDAEGFRRLDDFDTFDLVEKDNVAMIKLSQISLDEDMIPEFKIYLPWNTSLDISANSRESQKIEIESIRGDLVVHGWPGKIELDNLTGAILIAVNHSQKISIEFEETPTKPISISGGFKTPIELELPSKAKADLLLQTRSGKIRTNFSEKKLKLTEPDSKERASELFLYQKAGKLNGGGVKIHLTTDEGSITIKEDD
ncbi:MAG: hypothetical protein LBV12_08425 [Puniceicoccales bacterium]|jgi:hypothetical protein|nr:hypothetical protein [Puniceicoccales bacterium]